MSDPTAPHDTREQTADGLQEVIASLTRVHDRCVSYRERRPMERALEYLRDAEMLARQQHHT